MIIQELFIILSLLLTLLFFLYGFNHYYLLNATRSYHPPALPDHFTDRPSVSIHLPLYNERYVIRRLVAACADMALAYDIDKVTIKILDDSTDDTSLEVDRVVEEYTRKHVRMEVLRRGNRVGYKAGALQEALDTTDEEFIVIFDADFIPPPDFLLRTLPYFARSDSLGIIQSRWAHLNRNYNLLTRAIAIGIDVHFIIEQTGRYAAGCLQNFNGSGGVIRKKAILEAGGWQSDTLAEDLDLSYRIQNQGYKILYLNDLQSPAEVPPTVPSFKKQQGRWACGSLRTARKLLPDILHNPRLNWKQRFQASIHLTSYMLHPLIFFSFLLICATTLLGMKTTAIDANFFAPLINGYGGTIRPDNLVSINQLAWLALLSMIAICAIAPWISMVVTLKSQHLPVSRNLISLLITFLLGYGISLSNTIEAGKALLTNREWEYKRTPKYADLKNDTERKMKKYQTPLDFEWILELAVLCLGITTIAFAIWHSDFGILPILIPYLAAYVFVFSFTIIQSRQDKAA